MGKRIREKLHSRKGLSLMMAMLLLLVCTVLGAVLLVSATTTNSTAVSAADDQSYYALNSALDLLHGQLNDERAQVRVTVDPDGNITARDWCTVDDSGAITGTSPNSFAKTLAIQAIGDPVSGESGYALADSFSIVPKINGTPQDNLAVQVTVAATKNGGRTLVLKMTNTPAGASAPASLTATLTADILREELKKGDNAVEIYTVNWSISDVKRSSAS